MASGRWQMTCDTVLSHQSGKWQVASSSWHTWQCDFPPPFHKMSSSDDDADINALTGLVIARRKRKKKKSKTCLVLLILRTVFLQSYIVQTPVRFNTLHKLYVEIFTFWKRHVETTTQWSSLSHFSSLTSVVIVSWDFATASATADDTI